MTRQKSLILFAVFVAFVLSSCMQTRYLTEKYIKTNIEQHKVDEFSSIRTYAIFKGATVGGSTYLELTGYKYESKKALVIGTDDYYAARKKFKEDQTIVAGIAYIELTAEQCKAILDNYKVLLTKIKAEKPKRHEEVYHDFTVSDDLFISYSKSVGRAESCIHFWILGAKYSIATNTIIKKLNKFMDY